MNWNSLSELQSNLAEFDKSMIYKDSLENFYKSINRYSFKKPAYDEIRNLMSMYRHDRQFEYNSIVISLYGYLELFVESIICDYVEELRKLIKSYSDLDKDTKVHYRREMIAMYNKRKSPKLAHLTDSCVSENLYNILHGDNPVIMPEAFFQSGGNYNFKEITACFKSLGCKNIISEIKQYDPLRSFFASIGAKPSDKNEDLYQKLDDLVSRRNEIAHGSNKGNILSKNILKQYKVFLKVFCESLASYLSDSILRKKWDTLSYEARCSHMFSNNRAQLKGEFPVFKDTNVIQYRKGVKPEFIENKILNLYINGIETAEYLSQQNSTDTFVACLENKVNRGNLLRFD